MALYIIGGASRSGKSVLARKLLHDYKIPYFSTDFLRPFIKKSAPQINLSSARTTQDKALDIWPGLQNMLQSHVDFGNDYLIEGDLILPAHIRAFLEKNENADIRVCFLGYAQADMSRKIQAVRTHKSPVKDWSKGLDDAALKIHIQKQIDFSRDLERDCKKYKLPYIDTSTSENFDGTIDGALNLLAKVQERVA